MAEPVQVPPGTITREDYYRWTEAQPRGRFELVEGEVVAMAPERVAHMRAKARVWRALDRAIASAGLSCEALPDGATIEVGDDTAYEPDAVVHCGEALDDDALGSPEPVVAVEVTSPSNSRVDLTTKFTDYFRVPSIRHYLIVHLRRRTVIHHRRTDDGRIESAILSAGPIALDPPGITIRVEELFG
jgi:Uma2 family endonuclease